MAVSPSVVATPGHPSGHVSFCLPGRRLLCAEDASIHWGERIAAPPVMFTRGVAEAQRSIEQLVQLAIGASLPGPGAPFFRTPLSLVGGHPHQADTASR